MYMNISVYFVFFQLPKSSSACWTYPLLFSDSSNNCYMDRILYFILIQIKYSGSAFSGYQRPHKLNLLRTYSADHAKVHKPHKATDMTHSLTHCQEVRPDLDSSREPKCWSTRSPRSVSLRGISVPTELIRDTRINPVSPRHTQHAIHEASRDIVAWHKADAQKVTSYILDMNLPRPRDVRKPYKDLGYDRSCICQITSKEIYLEGRNFMAPRLGPDSQISSPGFL